MKTPAARGIFARFRDFDASLYLAMMRLLPRLLRVLMRAAISKMTVSLREVRRARLRRGASTPHARLCLDADNARHHAT